MSAFTVTHVIVVHTQLPLDRRPILCSTVVEKLPYNVFWPAVGGLAIPLVLNSLFYFIALQICKILKIPDEEQASILCVSSCLKLTLWKQPFPFCATMVVCWSMKKSHSVMYVQRARRCSRNGAVPCRLLATLQVLRSRGMWRAAPRSDEACHRHVQQNFKILVGLDPQQE